MVHPRVCGEIGVDNSPHHDRSAVHPRVCGEIQLFRDGFSGRNGSPPRVRGNRPDGAGG